MELSKEKKQKYTEKASKSLELQRKALRRLIEENKNTLTLDTVWVGAMTGDYYCYIFSGDLSLSGVVDDSGTAITMSFDGTPSGGSLGLAELTGVMTFSIEPHSAVGSCTFQGYIEAAEEGGAYVTFYQGTTTVGQFVGEAEGISAGSFSGNGTWTIQ